MTIAAESTGFSRWDLMFYRISKATGETRQSLDRYGIDYLLNLNEILDLEDYMKQLELRDSHSKELQRKRLANLGQSLKGNI